MSKINARAISYTRATILAGSMSPYTSKRACTFILTYPRIIHAEAKTHRQLMEGFSDFAIDVSIMDTPNHTKNSGSSRAIPALKMISDIETYPFYPKAWAKAHKGMQGYEFFDETETDELDRLHEEQMRRTLDFAKEMTEKGVSKQIINRYIENYSYVSVLLTGTEWENFFELRCPKYRTEDGQVYDTMYELHQEHGDCASYTNVSTAEIHIQDIAEKMKTQFLTYNKWKMLSIGEWHLPFETDSKEAICKIKRNVSIAARGSYGNFKEKTEADDISMHDGLLTERHMSPFGHVLTIPKKREECARKFMGYDLNNEAKYEDYWCNEYHGFASYRYLIEKNMVRSYL